MPGGGRGIPSLAHARGLIFWVDLRFGVNTAVGAPAGVAAANGSDTSHGCEILPRLHFGIPLDTLSHMNTFHRSDEFDAWLAALKDKVGRARIALRIRSAEHGNFGDCEPVGEGVSEMRIHFGPGYRIYFTRRDEVIYLLLLGGDKSSQKRDIKRAIEMARTLNKE